LHHKGLQLQEWEISSRRILYLALTTFEYQTAKLSKYGSQSLL
jgi:hypothetical protein